MSGSKKGERRGGRQKGTPNKRTTELYAKVTEGETPLEYLLRRMRDKTVDDSVRTHCAVAAAPYCHPRLASTEITGANKGPLQVENLPPRLELAKTLAHHLTLAANEVSRTRH